MSSKRKMKARKKSAENRARRGGSKPSGRSKYALKVIQQNRGKFSPRSPFQDGPVEEEATHTPQSYTKQQDQAAHILDAIGEGP